MAIDLTKVPLLSHVQYLYGDIRDRIKEKYSKPEEGIPASDLAPGVIPDIGLIENSKAPIIMETASGNPIVITDGAAGLPLSECKLTLLPRQSGSGDASPDNVRPLIPWENVGTWTGRKNLLNPTAENLIAFQDSSYNKYTLSNGVITTTGNALVGFLVPVVPSTRYIYSLEKETNAILEVFAYTEKPDLIRNADTQVGYSTTKSSSFITPQNCHFVVCAIISTVASNTISNFQLEVGNTVTAYEAPMIAPHPVDISSITPPVYGCEIHLTTGEVWGTWADKAVSETRPEKKADYIFQFYFSDRKCGQGLFGIISDSYKTHTNVASTGSTIESLYAQYGDGIYINSGSGTFYICDSNYTDVDDFKTAMADAKIAYELSTPVLLATLSPQEIETLLGTNTIWSDADSINVEYRADTELFINQNGVKDVQANGTSVLQNGVANIPIALPDRLGLFAGVSGGIYMSPTSGKIQTNLATASQLKAGTNANNPVVPQNQHTSAFYALAKVAGADMAQSSNAVGTYTDAAKQAIQKLFGLDGLVGPYEADITADQAYAIGETFVMDGKRYKATAAIAQGGIITPGTNCELCPLSLSDIQIDGTTILNNGIANIPKASNSVFGVTRYAIESDLKLGTGTARSITPSNQHTSVFYGLSKLAGYDLKNSDTPIGTYPAEAKAAILAMLGAVGETDYATSGGIGVVKVNANYGTAMRDSPNQDTIMVAPAGETNIKLGVQGYQPITPSRQHISIFYGLSKLAGVDLASGSDVVGVYPQNAKDAIQSMLGIEADIPLVETVSGTTPSITGMPNVRYICGTCSLLTITPPASGSIVVRFSSGSTATVLTVPNTVKFPAWFDPTDLEANTTYELIITDGVYGGAMAWAD